MRSGPFRCVPVHSCYYTHRNLSISYGIVSSKIYDKRDDFTFEIVNFPFLD